MTAHMAHSQTGLSEAARRSWWATTLDWLRRLAWRVQRLPGLTDVELSQASGDREVAYAQYHGAGFGRHAPAAQETPGRSAMVFRRDDDTDRPALSLRQSADDASGTGDSEQFTPVNRGEFYAHLPGAQPTPERPDPSGASASVIAADAIWTGTLVTGGAVQVFGAVHGDHIEAQRLEVAPGASVEATVVVGECSIAGTVDGTIECRERLEVTASGVVRGSVSAGTLVVQEGAVILGQLRMRDSYVAALDDTTVSDRPVDS